MSRSFFIGLIASLAVLVSAGPALGGGQVLVGADGNGAVARCNDGTPFGVKRKVIRPTNGFFIGRWSEGVVKGLFGGEYGDGHFRG